MITLITGVPGSGKTLYAIKMILNYQKENERLREQGQDERAIYCNIAGLNIDGVITFEAEPKEGQATPLDWRDTPDGSIVIYDECQKIFGPDGQGRSKRGDIAGLETHRHTGHDIVFITQRERLLHSHIRDLVGRHHHIQRQHGTHTTQVFTRDETIDTKSKSALNACDSGFWRYDKSLFNYYKSATVHTHKPTMPKWLFRAVALMLIAIAGAVFFGYKSMDFISGDVLAVNVPDVKEPESSILEKPIAKDSQQEKPVQIASAPKKIMGCVVWNSGNNCRCYHDDGAIAQMTVTQCKAESNRPAALSRPDPRRNLRDLRAARAPSERKTEILENEA
jgi:zona occludens toxin (predicted ATPase)